MERTPEGKSVLFHQVTGQRFERWPVDAREMLASGDYTESPNASESPAPAVTVDDPVPHVTDAIPKEHSNGVPLVVAVNDTTSPAQPVELPAIKSGKKK